MVSRGTIIPIPEKEDDRVHAPKASNNYPLHQQALPKPKKTPEKRNLVSLTKPDRSKLSKPRKINVQKFPTSTSQLNWNAINGKNLTQEGIDAAHSVSTNLAPMQGIS